MSYPKPTASQLVNPHQVSTQAVDEVIMSFPKPTASQVVNPHQMSHAVDVEYDPDELNPLDNLVFREVTETDIQVFYAPNVPDSAKSMFRIPTLKTGTGMPKPWSLKEMLQPQYFYQYQPYLGFVPVENVFEGPIFGRFRGNRSYFATQVVPHGLEFRLNPFLAMSWIRVQNALAALIADFNVRLKPIDLEADPFPTDTMFFKPRSTVDQVVRSVLFAQRLFLKLIAELRYSICVSPHGEGDWIEAMKTLRFARTVDRSWLFDLTASKAMTTQQLAGTVFRPTAMPSASLIRRFIRHECPVYIPVICIRRTILSTEPLLHGKDVSIYSLIEQAELEKMKQPLNIYDALCRARDEWLGYYQKIYLNVPYVPGPVPATHTDDLLEPAQPQPELAPPSPLSPQYYPHPNDALESPQSPNVEAAEGDLPSPYPSTLQRPGQWWYQFFKNAQSEHKLSLENEAYGEFEREQQAIIVKMSEELRCKKEYPVGERDVCYVWEPTPQHPTFLLRRRVEDHELSDIWRSTPYSNRIFNAGMHEWDLYHRSCDMTTLTRSATGDEEAYEEDVEIISTTQAPQNDEVTRNDISQDAQIMRQMRLQQVEMTRMPLFCEKEPAQSASRRHGFLFPHPPLVYHDPSPKVKWYFLLGYKDIPVSTDEAIQLSQTLTCLQECHGQHLCELLDILKRPTSIIDCNDVLIRHIPNAVFKYSHTVSRNLYILSFRGDNRQDWFIGTSQAQDIVFAMREGKATSRDVLVRFFLEHGIQFYTLAPVLSNMSRDSPFLEPCQLPEEPVGREYTMTDFYEYERRREEFLDSPYGRIASRSGGVVARLWRRDVSKFEQRRREVNLGPTERAFFKGIRVCCGRGEEFYDDELTAVMGAFICGQYKARKSKLAYLSKNIN